MGAAIWYRFRAELRTRWRAWLGLALLVGLAGGAVLALAGGARRTDSAYRRFLDAQRGYDVLVVNNPGGISGEGGRTALFDLDEIRALPEVADAAPVGTFFVLIGAGVGVFVPPDDHIGTGLNEFKMLEGRRVDPERPDEAVVSFTFAERYDLGIGDEIDIIDPSFRAAYEESTAPGADPLAPEDAELAAAIGRILEVLPDGKATIVGIQASPGQFPPRIEAAGNYLVHVSPALYPLRADLAGISEGGDSLLIRLERGAADTDIFLDRLQELGGGDVPDVTVARELNDNTQRSFRTQAVALWLLAFLVAIAGVLIIGQLLARMTSIESADNPVLSSFGATPNQLAVLGLCRAAAIGMGGAVLAAGLALAVSPVFPTGLARTAEPDPGLRFDALVTLLGVLGVVVVVVAVTAWPVWRSTRVAQVRELPSRVSFAAQLLARRSVPVPVGSGVRMALEPGRGRQSVPVRTGVFGIALGVATLVAALTFAASLAHLLATPQLYGHTWDVELTTYDATMIEVGIPVLEDDDRVVGVAQGDFRFPFVVEGEGVDGFAMDTVAGELSPAILEGRRPRARDEIALGTKTMRTLDVAIGDSVNVGVQATVGDPVAMEVVGRAVFPIFSELSNLGEGALTSLDAIDYIRGGPSEFFEQGVLVRVASPEDVDGVTDRVQAALSFERPLFVIQQGKPTDIVNFGRVEATPYLVGAVLAVLATASLAYVLVSAVRRRRRELAILKTLGFVRGQVRATVAWQATTLAAVALLVGVPVGVAIGRTVWTRFADDLGVVAQPRIPLLVVALLVPLAAVAIANLVAAGPAAAAAETRPARILRSE